MCKGPKAICAWEIFSEKTFATTYEIYIFLAGQILQETEPETEYLLGSTFGLIPVNTGEGFRIWPEEKFTATQTQRTTLVDPTGRLSRLSPIGPEWLTFKPFNHHDSLWLSVIVVRMWLWATWLFTSDTIPEGPDSWRLLANSTPCSWDNKLLHERGVWATHVHIHPNIQYYDKLLQINTKSIQNPITNRVEDKSRQFKEKSHY